MIRSYETTLRFANSGKRQKLAEFLTEYRKAVQLCIDFFWNTSFAIKNKIYHSKMDQVKLPKYLDYKLVNYQGVLSARAFCSAMEQAFSILKSQLKQREQLLWIINKLKSDHKETTYLEKKLSELKFIKPIIGENLPARLSSKCVDFELGNSFDRFIRLKSTGFDHLKLPVRFYQKMKLSWELLGEIRITENKIWLTFKTNTPEKRTEGKKIGGDQGIKTVITLSDGQITKTDIHGHNLDTITNKLSRKKKASKGFRRAQDHRKNYINWSINQLNFDNIKELGLEKINVFKVSRRSKKLASFAHELISRKITNLMEEIGVQVSSQSSIYRSQRCSGCGMVCQKHRKRGSKVYQCSNCGIEIDADLNAAKNHEIELPDIPYEMTALKLNKTGFFWKEAGLFDLDGQEIRVSDTNKEYFI